MRFRLERYLFERCRLEGVRMRFRLERDLLERCRLEGVRMRFRLERDLLERYRLESVRTRFRSGEIDGGSGAGTAGVSAWSGRRKRRTYQASSAPGAHSIQPSASSFARTSSKRARASSLGGGVASPFSHGKLAERPSRPNGESSDARATNLPET